MFWEVLLKGDNIDLLTAPVAALIVSWFSHFLLGRWAQSENQSVRACLASAFRPPLLLLPWLLCFFYLAHWFVDHSEEEGHDWLATSETVSSVLLPLWLLLRLIRQLPKIAEISGVQDKDLDLARTLSRFFHIVLIVLAVMILAQKLGYSLSALLTFGGVGGLIVGMAAREWLANFFGGLMLMLDKPFKEGDWIRSPDRQIEGHVEHIGWRLTQIRNFDRRPVFVPNSVFTSIVLENPSRMRNRRVVENFGIRYEDLDKIPAVMNEITTEFLQHPELDCSEPHYARFLKYGDSSLECQVRVHVIPKGRVDFVRVQESVMLIIASAVQKAGAEFAYPVMKVIHKANPEPESGNSPDTDTH
ncbi:mechanosensitive ion channel family protein [Endozoicomonas sp. 8E]|uniref:mechanosensitive ion channel family protein n=1 Tax=Endozoicomonas sp. 8E TaxID=3035692 RepID=UPI002938CF6E|nr:mechanosensitive ion channel family protein [Endozoicomonas sp. 8E]WOG25336.1 mechanosensitive ion channel family protein [Endozoicomonas sp. 8E]